ncbi:MAG TPA: hypothetical protein VMD30_02755 [Tepidisphaeraceae bacterium]|nr:hypothetical protein [Tepidisphaeraceae bacterium]
MKLRKLITPRTLFYAAYIFLLLLWTRSLFARDEVYLIVFGHLLMVDSFSHHLFFHWSAAGGYAGPRIRFRLGLPQIVVHLQYFQVRVDQDEFGWWLAIPYWLPVLLMSTEPIWRMCRALSRRRRIAQGRCANCGYDLRMSTDICPECGEPKTK